MKKNHQIILHRIGHNFVKKDPILIFFALVRLYLKILFFYNVFHKKSNTVQIRVSKRGDKRSTWLNGLSELVSYAVSKLANEG
jgi:hypothetical protein